MLKKVVSLLLVCVMLFGMVPVSAFAAEDTAAAEPVETEAPVQTETAAPAETEAPPAQTEEPAPATEPETTAAPEETTVPEETTPPEETETVTTPVETEPLVSSEEAAAAAEEEEEPSVPEGAASLDTSNLSFDVTEPAGYVTISFTDNGVRPENASINNAELYGTAVGTIIAETEVPYVAGDTVADVTVRLLDAMDLAYDYTGTVEEGFYLAALLDFELNGTYYPQFGEFDAGNQSGWCVRLNNWHINQGTDAFEVEDGDTVSWLYTCQYGADVGADYSTKSAAITGVELSNSALSLAYDEENALYLCKVPESTASIAFEVELENYASVLTVTVDGNAVKYRPNKAIPVTPNSTIVISTQLEYTDTETQQTTLYTDDMTIQLTANKTPTVNEDAVPATMEVKAGQSFTVDLSPFFADEDSDSLTYCVSCAALGINQTLEGSTFTGVIPVDGTYEVVVTASDGMDSASHTVTITVTPNSAPNIKAAYAETGSNTYVYSSSYVYIYMDTIFEDADGDTLTYEATLDGEKVDITYSSWEKRYYIQFAAKPAIREYKIRAYDGITYSEEFTARCIGTTATITADSPLILGGTYYYYIMGTAEKDTFAMAYTLDVDTDIVPQWMSSNTSALTSNGDGTFSVGGVTGRTSLYTGVTYGKDNWGGDLYLGTRYLYILPGMPAVADITAPLAEHADAQTATVVSSAFANGWYSSEFDYQVANPNICNVTTSGTYGLSITPKALGTTTVIATFKYDESIKCYFNITVTGRSLQIQGQPGSDDVIFEDGKTVQLEVLGAEEGETFTFTSADEAVATVDETGLVTLKGLGQTYITAAASTGAAASMYLQVKEAGRVYLDDLAVTDYSYFEGFVSAKSGFNSAQLTYDWALQESRYTYNKLAFTPYFDDEKLDAVLHYQVSGGEYQTMALEEGKAVSITNGLNPGENVVKIDVYPADDPENVTTYTLNIFRPYNPTKTVNSMTIYPNGETALAYPTHEGYKEGTLFRWNAETGAFVTGWNGAPSTGWSSSVYTYKVFAFGTRTSGISLYPSFGYVNERVMIYVNGERLEEAVTNWKSSVIPLSEDGTEITLKVCSEKYYAEQSALGVDPYETPETTYTIYVESVDPLGIESKILSAEIEGGEFYAPGFTSSSYSISALIPNGETTANLSFTVPAGIDVYKTSVTDANKLTPAGQDGDGNNLYTTEIVKITGTGSRAYSTTNIILQITDEEGNVGKTQYAFTVSQRGEKDIYPDSIAGYLCVGSQYTNASSYGTMPERTLKNGGGTLSLGNFGGYIIYKYDTPIENDPNNPYGVDLVIYGNSFGNGAHEPGYVQVSADGETWYTLAGSDHYEDHNDWGFSMTYTNVGGKSAWTNSDGESGQIYNYPSASLYPYFSWTEELEQSMTVTGPRLNSSAKDAYGSAAAVLPDFGYVDVNTNGTINGVSNNPYNHPGTLVAGGDQFDLSWAVDENGMPVKLDSISYVRIATASSIYAGAIGEKSTEVATAARVTNRADGAVGVTAAPASITVNGAAVSVPANGTAMILPVAVDALDVSVSAAEDTNIYIGSENGASRSYGTIPDKGIVRIIVQEGQKEPYICYLTIESTDEETAAAVNAVAELINAIGDVDLSSADAIEAARAAYDALPEYQKRLVSNYDILTAAEAELRRLKDENTAVPVNITVTISNAGRPVMARQSITVTDKNDNGFFDVDDALTIAHEAGCPGGYASAETQWGLGVTKLWGDTSGAFGYWLNNSSCWSAEDTVAEGDSLVAFVYQDQNAWSDAYAAFGADAYEIEEDQPLTVSVEKANYDENWNVFFAPCDAVLTVYDSSLNEIDPSAYMQSGNKITIYEDGEYYLAASGSGDTILVPAIARVTVTNGPDLKLAGGKSVTLKAYNADGNALKSSKVKWTLAEEYAPYASISSSGKLTAKKVMEMVSVNAVAVDAADGETVVASCRVDIYPAVSQVKILDESDTLVNGKTVPLKVNDGSDETLVFSAGTYPDGAMGDVTWTVSDKKGTYVTYEVRGNDIIVKPAGNAKKGTVTLTATATDGSKKKAAVKLSVAVLVEKLDVTTKDGKNLILDEEGTVSATVASGKSITLKAAPTNANATNKAVTWSIVSGGEYAKITSAGKLTAVKDLMGVKYATVRAEAKDGSGVYSEIKVKLTPLALGVRMYNSGRVCTNTTLTQNMTAQNTLTLNARVYPLGKANQSVTWKSSNPKVATIELDEKGYATVTCRKAGKVTITATADDGSKEKAVFTLKIVEGVGQLTLEDQAVAVKKSLKLGSKIKINPTTATNKKLKWEIVGEACGAAISGSGVLNTKKVDVSNGPVKLTVQASPLDGCGAEPVQCTVTVYPATTKITLKNGEETVTGGKLKLEAGKSLTLTGECAGAANVYTWKSSNKNVAVEDGVVTAAEAAVGKTVTITCTAADGTGVKATVKVTITAPATAE